MIELTWVIFFQDQNTDACKAFLEIAAEIEDMTFGITSIDVVFTEFLVQQDTVVGFKKVNQFNTLESHSNTDFGVHI